MLDPFEELSRRKTAPVEFNDFDIPFAPLSRTERQFNWGDDFFVSPPAPPAGKGLPEYAVIEPESIMSAVQSIATSFDKGIGVAKKIIPGLEGFGDFLGNVGRAPVGNSTIGGSLDKLIQPAAQTGEWAMGETVRAVGNRLGEIGQQIGWTFDDQNPDSFKILDAPFRIAGSAFLGKTGGRAFDFGIKDYNADAELANVWEEIGQTANIAALAPGIKGAIMGVKAISSAGALGSFMKGLATPLVRNTQASQALAMGRITGRISLATSGVGLAADFALPKIDPDAPWAKDILDNRIVAENSPWRFPVELATTLPMDLFALAKVTASHRYMQAAWTKVHGTPPLPSQIQIGDSEIKRLIDNGLATMDDITDQDDHWFRQYAEEHAVKVYNLNAKGELPEAKRIADIQIWDQELGKHRSMSQAEAREFIKVQDAAIMRELGPGEYAQRAAQTWAKALEDNGMAFLSTEQKIIYSKDYVKLARVLEQDSGMSVQVASDAAHEMMQAQAALGYLDNVKALGFKTKSDLKVRYPALAGHIDEADTIDELRGQFAVTVKSSPAPEYVKIGQLEALLDQAARASNVDEVLSLQKSINEMREQASKHWGDRIEFLKGARFAREAELNGLKGDLPDAAMDAADAELARIDHLLQDAQLEHAKAFLAGSRWELQHQPGMPIMRVIDTLDRDFKMGSGGTAHFGKVFDTLFGAVPNMELGRKAYMSMQEAFLTAGNSSKTIRNFYDAAHKYVLDHTHGWKSGFAQSQFVTVYHIPSWQIDRIAREAKLVLPQGKSAHQVLYEAWPGPIKQFQQRVTGGKALNIPYNKAFVNISRSIYPMLRFYLSPRFVALNIGEPKFISAFLGRRGLKPNQEFLDIAESQMPKSARAAIQSGDDLLGETQTGVGLKIEGQRALAHRIAQVAWSRRTDDLTDSVLRVVHDHPAMDDLVKEMGTQEKWVEFLDNAVQGRVDTLKALNASTKAEQAIADDIKRLTKELGDPKNKALEPELLARKRMKEDEFIKSRVQSQIDSDANARAMLKYDKFRPFIDAMKIREEQLIKDMRRHYIGNPNRSATERLLNSFMLYWPISYQLKASRIMLEMAFSRGFGLRTGSTVADSWLQLRKWHEREITENPKGEWAELHRNNRQLIFVMRQFVPITPEDVGTRLSSLVTTPYKVFKGELSVAAGFSRVTNVGPVYDVDLATRVLAQETNENGLLYEFLNKKPDPD